MLAKAKFNTIPLGTKFKRYYFRELLIISDFLS
jgi:hypothetical protein